MNRKALRRAAALVAAFAVLTTACGDDSEGTDNAPGEETATPQQGGTITYGVWIEASGLDPLVVGGPNIGGVEAMAVYDTVMRWNPETREYEPRMAESLESNDNHTVWTLRLRSGIKFSDGTDFNAEAVKLSFERHQSSANTTNTRDSVMNVASMTVEDPLTLRFDLTEPWPAFPVTLAGRPGMVPSPTALAKCQGKAPRECEFNLSPVGAGPFVVQSFRPKEAIVMTRNPKHYGGDVYLDELRFVALAGPDATFEALDTGGLDMALLRSAPVIDKAKNAGFTGHSSIAYGGAMTLINMGLTATCKGGEPAPLCTGKPDGPTPTNPATANPKVRQAVAAATNVDVLNERVWGGKALVGTEIFQEDSAYFTGVGGHRFDLERAKTLVAEAKAEGWDGRIRYNCYDDPTNRQRALAHATMLEAAGMTVEVAHMEGSVLISRVIVGRDYDLSCWGFPLHEDDSTYNAVNQNMSSTSAGNRVGWKNPTVDAAVRSLKAAESNDEKVAALKIIEEQYLRDVPFVVEAAEEEFVAVRNEVHGLYATLETMVYLDKVWVER